MVSVLPLLLVLALVTPGLGDAVDSPPESIDPATTEPSPAEPTEPVTPSEPATPTEPATPPEPSNPPPSTPQPAPAPSEGPVCPEDCETCCRHGVCAQNADNCTWIEGVPDWATVLIIVGGFLLVTMLVSWLLKACTAKKNPDDDWLREHLLTDKIPTVRAGDPFKSA